MRLKIPPELTTLLSTGLSQALGSLVVKIATAGLTYITFVVLSRTMTQSEYGHFAFGLALATVLAIAAAMGQPTAILRFWPEAIVAGHRALALRAVRAGTTLIVLASLLVAVGLVTLAFIITNTVRLGDTTNHLYGAAFLILPMALAEFNSAALRAQGSLWTALLPRDIVWRLAMPLGVIALYAMGIVLSGPDALVLSAALLVGALGLQYWMALRCGFELRAGWAGTASFWAERGGISRWLLLGALIETAALNVDVILVGLFDSLANSAIYFNAFRTAALITLISYAIVLIIAPMITRSFYARDLHKAQVLSTASVWVGFAFALAIMIAFVLFGAQILSLFGTDYQDGRTILVLLAAGLLVDAATGPSRTLMMTTGHERTYVFGLGGITLVTLAIQILVLPAHGLVGLALVNMLGRIVSQAFMALWCIRQIGIDPTIFGILRLRRNVLSEPIV